MTDLSNERLAETEAMAVFTEYFVRNYPGPDTIIFDPNWHAPNIFRAALHAIRPLLAGDEQNKAYMEAIASGGYPLSDDPSHDLIASQAAEIERGLERRRQLLARCKRLEAEKQTAERLLAEATGALEAMLNAVPETLDCGRHCIIESEAKDEAEYAAVIVSARTTLSNIGGHNGK